MCSLVSLINLLLIEVSSKRHISCKKIKFVNRNLCKMMISRKNLLMKICDNRKIPYHKEKLSWSWTNQQCLWFSKWLTYATKCSCKPPLWSQPSFQASKCPICEILFRLAKYHKKGKWTILTGSCRMRFHIFPYVEQLLEFQIWKKTVNKWFDEKTYQITQRCNFSVMSHSVENAETYSHAILAKNSWK